MGLKENFRQAAKELITVPQGETESAKEKEAEVREQPVDVPITRESVFRREGRTLDVAEPRASVSQRTIIAEGAVIQGSIRSAGGIEILGEVHGDVSCQEDLKLSGKLEGNVTGKDVTLCGGKLKGDITATGRIQVDATSVVLGNIKADSLYLNGKVKGDLEVKESLVLEKSSAVLGQISTGRISMAEGAAVQGELRISTSQMNATFPDDLFGAPGKKQ